MAEQMHHNCYALLTSPNLLIFFLAAHTRASTSKQHIIIKLVTTPLK